MLRRFISYYSPHRKLFILDMTMAFVRACCAICIPYLTHAMLKDYLPSGDLPRVLSSLGIFFGLIVVMTAATYINMKWGHFLGARMETDMRSDLFHHLQKLSFRYFDNTKTGHIMSRISNDLFTISEVAHHAPEDFFIYSLIMVGGFSIMFHLNAPLATVALVPLPLMIGWGTIFGRRMRHNFRSVRKRIADINSNVENAIQGIREVKSFTNEPHEIEKFGVVNVQFRAAKERMYGTMAGFHSGMSFLSETYWLAVLGGGALLMHYGHADLPDVIAFLLYIRFIMNPIKRLVGFVEQFQQGAASFERFVEILNVEPEITDRPGAVAPRGRISGGIEIDDLWFRYEPETDWVLRGISLAIPPGCSAALVGESGAGKSTLAALVPRFYEAQRGNIRIDGQNIMELKQRFLRRNIGLVQQNVFLFDSSVRENIMFGRPGASEEELVEAARKAHIHDFVMSLPEDFDTLVGEHGVKLSGGQRQRISIARVFLKDPPILIFDEATSSLDTESEAMIKEAMDLLCRDRTTVIIAHRLSTVKNADYTYVLRGGCMVEHGRHEELLAAGGYYQELYANSLI